MAGSGGNSVLYRAGGGENALEQCGRWIALYSIRKEVEGTPSSFRAEVEEPLSRTGQEVYNVSTSFQCMRAAAGTVSLSLFRMGLSTHSCSHKPC